MRVLVAEDDDALRSVLERGLRGNGYVIDAAADGMQAVVYSQIHDYEVVIPDWGLPKTTGTDAVQHMRRQGGRTPVLMLTARAATADRVTGLNLGTDDNLVKPLNSAELVARLQARQRRPSFTVATQIICGDLLVNPPTVPGGRRVRRHARSSTASTATTVEEWLTHHAVPISGTAVHALFSKLDHPRSQRTRYGSRTGSRRFAPRRRASPSW